MGKFHRHAALSIVCDCHRTSRDPTPTPVLHLSWYMSSFLFISQGISIRICIKFCYLLFAEGFFMFNVLLWNWTGILSSPIFCCWLLQLQSQSWPYGKVPYCTLRNHRLSSPTQIDLEELFKLPSQTQINFSVCPYIAYQDLSEFFYNPRINLEEL